MLRTIGRFCVAAAEWVVGLLVLLYIVWGMCYDHLVVQRRRNAAKATPEVEPGPPRRRGRRRSHRAAAAQVSGDGRRYLLH